MRVLIVEDDATVADLLCENLIERGHEVQKSGNGLEAVTLIEENIYDAWVVDVMLPGMDGISMIETMRSQNIKTPCLILSALGEVSDRVKGLKAGGDDYLVKPFAFQELMARLEVLVKRNENNSTQTVVTIKDLELDLLSRKIHRAGQEIPLQNREFKLLECLINNRGTHVTRQMLFENVWNYHFDSQTNVIDVHVSRLRKKIHDDGPDPIIKTVRGVGYTISK